MSSINDKLISYGNLATFHSNLLNDSSVSDKATWSSSKIASELALVGFDVQIVQELPASGDPHTIYFILKPDSSTGDVYDEWMYIDGNWEMVGNTQIDLSDYATINYVDEQIETLIGNANSEIDGKETEDFTFVQTLPAEGEEDQLVIIKGDNADTLYKYVSGEWVEQTPDANILYFDVLNEALYSYVTAQQQFAPISLVNTIVVGSNLNNNADLKALKTPGVYSVVQRLHNATKGDYVKNWTLYVESVDYEEYDKSDSVYQRLVSNYTIQKRTWSATRATNDGWSSFSTYYAGEIKDSTVSKYYTWSSNKLNASLGAKQDVLTAGQNISIDASNAISAEGYVFDSSNGSLATIYRQDSEDGGALVENVATGLYSSYAEGYQTIASGEYGSHTEGYLTEASGDSAHAEGYSSAASGAGAHAEGYSTIAEGMLSHAEGHRTIASGKYSHAEGYKASKYEPTTAAGLGAHAEGESTNAVGTASHTEGASTQALNTGEHAEGVLNLSHQASSDTRDAGNTRHSVGIGWYYKSDPSTLYRTNAVEIMGNGDQYIIGVGGYEGTDTKVQNASIKTVQEVINSKADAADLSSYATLAYVDSSLDLKADKSYVDASLALKADVYEVATTADIEALFAEPVPPTQPNDEIWYTTNNNEAITIDPEYADEYFDKPMLSNTYSDGKGIIKFDGDLTALYNWGFQSITEDYENITSIQLPESVTELGFGAFEYCSNLVSVKLPSNYTGGIPEQAFNECSSLESIEIPEGTTYIADGAFLNCSSLTTITIPSNVVSLLAAFNGCTSLESIICEPTTPPYASGYMFEDTNNCPIYVPAESVNAYKTAEGWTEYAGRIQAIQ